MRYSFFILLLISTGSFAQNKWPRKELKEETIRLRLNTAAGKALPFDRFVVVDNRFDTSKLGYAVVAKKFKKIQTANSLASDLTTALNTASAGSLAKNTKSFLWISVRHYWIQETDQAEAMKNKVDDLQNTRTLFTCKATFECFLIRDSFYYPVIRYDTLLTRLGFENKTMESIASESVQGLLERLEKINWNSGKKKMTREEAISFTRRYRDLVREPDITTPGIYHTFEDFRKGNIDTVKFVAAYYITDELYILRNGKRELLKDFWGYTDGKSIFINTGLNFYELVKEGDSYEIWGRKSLIRHGPPQQPYAPTLGGALIMGAISSAPYHDVKAAGKPFQLNMETGELY